MSSVDEFFIHNFTSLEISTSYNIVDKKLPHISKADPSGRTRGSQRIVTNIFHGTLAQFAVIKVLQKYSAINPMMYDQARTDNFEFPDPWDIKTITNSPNTVGKTGGKIKNSNGEYYVLVEVRSSYLQKKCVGISIIDEILACIQNGYRLISGYSTVLKPGEESKDLYFQVYWLYSQLDAESYLRNYPLRNYHQLCPNNYQKNVVVGFATPNLLHEKGHYTSLGQPGANYRCVLINDAYKCSYLSRYFNNT